jgi:two-component system phosphate regulon response regulator PhoB
VSGSGRNVAVVQQKAEHEMPPRIMIVEDEEPLLELLRYNFECAGYVVDTLTDGNRVEASLEKCVPDILIVDWMLPGLSGIELCWRLRRRPATRFLPLMMLTARCEEHDRARAIKAGADDYMVKPFSVRDLIARVEALLTRRNSGTWVDGAAEPA